MSAEVAITYDEPAHNETHLGHVRRFTIGGYAGAVIFEFDGDREDRQFYLAVSRENTAGAYSAYVQADTAGELVDIMHDDEALTWVISQAGYDEPKPHTTAA